MNRVRVAVLVACAGLALAGCGAQDPPAGRSGSAPASSGPTATAPPATVPPVTVPPASSAVPESLRFTGKTVDGADFSGESLAGRPAVLWFWAPWCPKCQGEASGVAETVRSVGGAVTFVGVAARDEVSAMRGFIERHGLGDFAHLADTDLVIWKRFDVVEQPAYAFITRDGEVEVVTSRVSKDELMRRAQALGG